MRANCKSIILTFLQLMLLICLVSCASTVPKDFVMLNTEKSEKIPMHAGLYIDPNIQKCRITQITSVTKGRNYKVNFSVGDALVSAIERTVKNIFQEVSRVDPTAKLEGHEYDIIVTPQLVHVKYITIEGFISATWIVETVINWNIVSLDGKAIYSNTIKGVEEARGTGIGKITRSLQDQFQKAQEDIYSSGWWKKQWWKSGN